tara:strand:+ start:404 stop:580 length:177 start_codon:yes stop_codon:yes gene_type:complete
MSKLKLLKMPYKYYIVTSIGEKKNNKRIKTFLVQAVLTLLFINAVIFFGFYLIMLIYG